MSQRRAPDVIVIDDDSARALRLRNLQAFRARRAVTVPMGPQVEPLVRLMDPALVVIGIDDDAGVGGPGWDTGAELRAAGYRGALIGVAARPDGPVLLAARRAGLEVVLAESALPGFLAEHVKVPDDPADAGSVLLLRAAAVDLATGEVSRAASRTVCLPPRALALLRALAVQPRRVMTREELIAVVWDGRASSRVVDRHIADLRKLLERDARAPDHIRTAFRVGYRFVP